MVEIVTAGPPSPYNHFDFKTPIAIGIIPQYESITKSISQLLTLYENSMSPQSSLDPDNDLKVILSIKETTKFDMSNVQSNEKPIISQPMFIRRIRPLIATYGNFYVTTLVIYF